MKTVYFVLLLFLPAAIRPLHAQAQAQGQISVWRCELPGGVFVVDPVAISSVSSHEYLVDGVARVNEVTISTTGSLIARFYYLEPVKLKSPLPVGQSILDKVEEKAKDAADRMTQQTGQEPVWKKVVKNYPTSTHAHTVEYRLESKEQLDEIFTSAVNAWRRRRDVVLKIP